MDTEGVAIRSGHHCTMPMHLKLSIPASARMSFCVYSTKEDVDVLIAGIDKARKILL
jgi:cysteine desulfurase/selenocysteine lyase